MKKLYLVINSLFFISTVFAQAQKVELFPLSDVRLLEGPFKQAQVVGLKYILDLEPDRLLAPFCEDAGITPKAPKYPDWESTGLNGHIGGHYLTALAEMYSSTGNEELLRRLNYMVSVLSSCQKKNGNGYVGGIPDSKKLWADIASGKMDVAKHRLNKYWVPWYNLHKTFAGFRDAYYIAGNKQAKEVLLKLTDWCDKLVSGLTDTQIQSMLDCEHGGMNEVLADVSQITGNKKYLTLAQKFSHKFILEPLLKNEDKLNGLHANTQIPKVIGFDRISQLSGDTTWHNAAAFFWETVVNNRTIAFGGNSVNEHFNPGDNFSSMLESKSGPETCNTYNMLKLSEILYTESNSLKYIDYYERALYNHILSSQHPGHGGFVYLTSIHPQHYRVYSQSQNNFWCCVGTGIENQAKYGEIIYSHNKDNLFVNLFIASKLNWKETGITLVQETSFPENKTTNLKLQLVKPAKFNLNIRYPSWVKAGDLTISINGKSEKINATPSSYITLKKEWKTGDIISINLPMKIKYESLPDNSPWVTFLYGPIVLAAKTDTSDLQNLYGKEGQMANGKLIPLSESPFIVPSGKNFESRLIPVKGKPLTFLATDLIYPDNYKNIELIPFYKVHDARYMIYWQITAPDKLQ